MKQFITFPRNRVKRQFTTIALIFLVLCNGNAYGQITTASLTGKITSSKGEPLIGCTVVASNAANGTRYSLLTNIDGLYSIQNMNVGGPYTVSVSFIGYSPQTREGIYLALGQSVTEDFILAESSTALSGVVVTSNKNSKLGTTMQINRQQLETMPTITRSVLDFTKTDSRNTNNSFGGSNFRYNNVTLDGAISNDAIGFSPSLGGISGTSNMPGSSTRSNPISIDAIQEIQTTMSPIDVRLGNFTGGSINAVTKSGTNQTHGSVYGFGRNQYTTRMFRNERFYDYQTGGSLGSAFIKDKLFYFANVEVARRREPLFYGADASGVVNDAMCAKIDSFMQARYQFSPGAYSDYSINTSSNKVFARLDWNINSNNTLTFRTNYLNSEAGNLERSLSIFKFGSQDFIQYNNQSSNVLEFKSRRQNLTNNLILGYTYIHDYRKTPEGAQVFPAIQINNVGTGANYAGSGQIFLGTDREAAIFNMHQSTFEITDNLSWFVRKHNIILGTHSELYRIKYGFINSWNGRVEYNNLNDFFASKPARIRGTYHVGDNSYDYNFNNPSADFKIYLLSLYAQDEYTVNKRFRITGGLRIDMPVLPEKPALNPSVNATVTDVNAGSTYTHTSWNEFGNQFLNQPTISPRIGFTYDVSGDKSLIVRGGSGIFTGRIPFAWIGYAYYNDGVRYNSVDYKNTKLNVINLNADPSLIYTQLPDANKSTTEVDLIDNNFKMPRIWRSNLASDVQLPGGIKLMVEAMFTKTLCDVKFLNINLKDSVRYFTSGPVNTPVYLSGGSTGSKVNTHYSNAYLLTNTTKGYRYELTGQLEKSTDRVKVMLAYTFGKSFDISNGIRNSMQSNWELNPALMVNDPALAYSNFDIRHKMVFTLAYKKEWSSRSATIISVFASMQSGSPFTYVYNNNFTGNGQQNVQLAYIPANNNDITLVPDGAADNRTAGQIWQELNDFISGDKYLKSRRGEYTERNGARTPWNNEVNLRIAHTLAFASNHNLQLSLDLFNLPNLLNSNWGNSYFVPNTMNSTSPFGLTQKGFDSNKNPTFTFHTPTSKPYSVDKLSSQWQAQVGVRYSF